MHEYIVMNVPTVEAGIDFLNRLSGFHFDYFNLESGTNLLLWKKENTPQENFGLMLDVTIKPTDYHPNQVVWVDSKFMDIDQIVNQLEPIDQVMDLDGKIKYLNHLQGVIYQNSLRAYLNRVKTGILLAADLHI